MDFSTKCLQDQLLFNLNTSLTSSEYYDREERKIARRLRESGRSLESYGKLSSDSKNKRKKVLEKRDRQQGKQIYCEAVGERIGEVELLQENVKQLRTALNLLKTIQNPPKARRKKKLPIVPEQPEVEELADEDPVLEEIEQLHLESANSKQRR